MTLIELVEASAARLAGAGVAFGHGTANAFDEAAWLVLWQLGLPIDDLDSVADLAVSPQQHDSVAELVTERIASRKPAAYLTREAWLQVYARLKPGMSRARAEAAINVLYRNLLV